jgi:hypothetical protein
MRYRFTAGAALLGALALSLTAALVPVPAQAGTSGPGLSQQRVAHRHRPPSAILSSVASYPGQG